MSSMRVQIGRPDEDDLLEKHLRRYGGGSGGSSSEISEIVEEEEEEELDFRNELFEVDGNGGGGGGPPPQPLATIREEVSGTGSLFSFDFNNYNNDVVYVEIGKHEDASMDGLVWAMSHLVDPPSTAVFLIHIFPEIKQIPTLLGMMPIDQANPEQKELHLAQERGKRREYLQKFLSVCSASKVKKIDTILIESSTEAKAILDLIPILNIRKLVVGTHKKNIRSRRISGTAGQILRGAPEFCEVKIICEGKEMADLVVPESPRSSSAASPALKLDQELRLTTYAPTFYCGSCFKPKDFA